jgi:hypothetical protein
MQKLSRMQLQMMQLALNLKSTYHPNKSLKAFCAQGPVPTAHLLMKLSQNSTKITTKPKTLQMPLTKCLRLELLTPMQVDHL